MWMPISAYFASSLSRSVFVQFTLRTILELRLDFCPEILFVAYLHNEHEGWAYGAVHAHADEQRWYATIHANVEEINPIHGASGILRSQGDGQIGGQEGISALSRAAALPLLGDSWYRVNVKTCTTISPP